MLSDTSHEIRQQADQALAEFLQEIKIAPVSAYNLCSNVYPILDISRNKKIMLAAISHHVLKIMVLVLGAHAR
jgi:hypothetical protein